MEVELTGQSVTLDTLNQGAAKELFDEAFRALLDNLASDVPRTRAAEE